MQKYKVQKQCINAACTMSLNLRFAVHPIETLTIFNCCWKLIMIKQTRSKMIFSEYNYSFIIFDDLISFNNKRFNESVSDIYPKELTIPETTESTSLSSYLTMLFTRDENNNITTKLDDKRDAFGFHIVNFPLCQSIFHQHQPMVSIHLSSFAMPVVVQL